MKLNLDKRRGPGGRRLLRLPRAASTPATPTAPAAPRPDVFDIMRSAPRRRATREEIMKLAERWGQR